MQFEREKSIATKMSNKNNHPSKLDGEGNKRKRSRNNKQQADNSTSYNSISFNKRASSGRPGSPHRYFDSSYDILMDTTTSALEATSNKQLHGIGNQVVHRHLNGLCIITAGNVIQKQLCNASNNEEDGILQIKTVKYHIQPSKDSQSARGKMRTKKKKKRKKQKHQNEETNDAAIAAESGVEGDNKGSKVEVSNHDGYVSPKDTLCTVTISNGQEIQLKCCVEGTVIEINNRLIVSESKYSSDVSGSTTDSLTTQRDASLLMKETLLDGYLAVIMPSQGVFPSMSKA